MTPAIPENERIEGVVEPSGYRLLIRIPNLEEQMRNWANLIRPDENRRAEEIAQLVGQVIARGPDAYQDKTKFPNGDWCQVGDFVMIRPYAGTRFSMRSEDGARVMYGLINDDTVMAVVRGDIRDIERT